ncbi:glycosyltransferase, partial [Salmonella enterica]|uniref:glycosyltransferase n=1 Tax=Salmonella enterica TaxID=28901 RepID=UPI000CC46F89
MRDFAVVIPAYRPNDMLPQYVNRLIKQGVQKVIVVNDGNEASYNELFQQLSQFERCIVLEHKYNSGKGAALKTGFSYFLEYHSDL